MRWILTAFTVVAIAVSTPVQVAPPDRFVIERIEVRNAHRVSPRVIVGETLLREGKEYSHDDLRAAAARLNHLPFLLSADVRLEEGHLLVIDVKEMNPFSFLIDARGIELDQDANRRKFDYDFGDPMAQWKDAALGVRWLVGGDGIAHFAMTVLRTRQQFASNYSAYELGYTRYDLFGTRAFATVNVRVPVDSVAEGLFTPEIIAGYSLTTRQTLTLDYEETVFRRDTLNILGVDFRREDSVHLISLAWTYDTTNQPFVPTRGTFVRVAPLRRMRDRASFRSVPANPPFQPFAQHINADGVDVAALHYWELSDVNSVSGGLLAGWGDVDDGQGKGRWRPGYQIVQGGYSRALRGHSRLEIDGRVVLQQRPLGSGSDDEGKVEASASWARRSAWGTLRLGVGYQRRH